MPRRAVLQLLAGAGLAVPLAADGHPIHEHLGDGEQVQRADARAAQPAFSPQFLDIHQFDTLKLLAERIVPGSGEARVAPFLDALLSVGPMHDQRRFVGSLGAFDMLAFERHGRAWKALTPDEQDTLLTEASTAAPGREPGAPTGQPAGALTIRDFFNDLRGWIAGAYYSSEAGLRELGWTGDVMFDRLPGCDHPGGHAGP